LFGGRNLSLKLCSTEFYVIFKKGKEVNNRSYRCLISLEAALKQAKRGHAYSLDLDIGLFELPPINININKPTHFFFLIFKSERVP